MRTELEGPLQAEVLLHELAATLRTLPFDERTRPLHLRALSLKRAVAGWAERDPDGEEQRAVCEELRAAEQQARAWRERLTRGPAVARATPSDPNPQAATGS